jgi:CRP-like cAMP-binding protein
MFRPSTTSFHVSEGRSRSSSEGGGGGGGGIGGGSKGFIGLSSNSIDENVQETIEKLRLNTEHGGGTRGSRRHSSVGQLSLLSSSSWDLHENSTEEKKILHIAKKAPPDYQVANLLEVDLAHRKINLGEKDMLERGLTLESQGDSKAAITCYTNAGAHSKDQQVSRMLLGNLHYRAGHFMTALKFYTVAISIIELKPEVMQSPQDIYLAYFNRGIINFRLGSDDDGLADIERAAKVKPDDIATHEILCLAKRRMGKYTESIDEAIISETHRQEKKRKDLLKAIEQAKLLKRIELGDVYDEDEDEENENSGDEDDEFDNAKDAAKVHFLRRKSRKMSDSEKNISRRSIVQQSSVAFANLTSSTNKLIACRRASRSDSSRNSDKSSSRLNSVEKQQKEAAANHISSNTAAIALRRKEYFKGLSQTKGLILNIPEYSCNSSLRERVAEARRTKDSNGDELNSGEGGFLKAFKIKNSLKQELFDELFLKPNPLQESLLVEPNKRLPQHLGLVLDNLKQFPFTSKLTLSNLHELASSLEYRALQNKDSLFEQNEESGAMMFLINGEIDLKMDASLHTGNNGMLDIELGTINSHSVLGHIDLLFRHPRPSIKKAIEDTLLQSIEQPSSIWDNSPMTIARRQQNMMNATQSVLNTTSASNVINGGLSNSNSHVMNNNNTIPHRSAIQGNSVILPQGSTFNPRSTFNQNNNNNNNNNGNNNNTGTSNGINESQFSRDGSNNLNGTTTSNVLGGGVGNTTTMAFNSMFDKKELENEIFLKQIHEFMTYWNKTGEDTSKLPRAVAPGLFLSYAMQSQCELLLLNEKDFSRILYDYCVQEFVLRLKGILASGIFRGWKPEDLVRLARMGQIITVKTGETIVKQGTKPSFLYIVLKGMCRVLKKPNRTEMLLQKLTVAEEKAQQHDLKYVFHHKVARGELKETTQRFPQSQIAAANASNSHDPNQMNNSEGITPLISPALSRTNTMALLSPQLSMANLNTGMFSPTAAGGAGGGFTASGSLSPTSQSGNPHVISTDFKSPKGATESGSIMFPLISPKKSKKEKKKTFASIQAMKDFSTSIIMEPPRPTEAESVRIEAGEEITKLKNLIHKANVLDAMEQKSAYQRKLSQQILTKQRKQHAKAKLNGELPPSSPGLNSIGIKEDYRTEEEKMLDLAYTLGNKYDEIKILQWPMIFGEACVIDPENGVSRGSVLGDTYCEVFAIHKTQLQTFQIDETFLDRVRGKSVVYPADPEMVVNLYREQEWKEYRKEVLKKVANDSVLRKASSQQRF